MRKMKILGFSNTKKAGDPASKIHLEQKK